MGGSVKMAENKGVIFAKTVQKHAGRAKEKILQKVGKVDRTADEIYDDHVQNFNKQQNSSAKLQKELNNYLRCVKAMQGASKSLYETLSEVYEPEFPGHDLLYVQSQNVEMLWQDLNHKLTNQVLIPLNNYQAQFPEMRKKMEKRGRKLVDFDGQRHSYQALISNKKREEAKIARAKEQLDEAKRTFNQINAELNEELPALHDSRIVFLVGNLQTLFSAEQVFHTELAKVHLELETIVEKLAKENNRGSFQIRRNSPPSPSSPSSPVTPTTLNLSNNTGSPDKARSKSTRREVVETEALKDYEPVEVGAQVESPQPVVANGNGKLVATPRGQTSHSEDDPRRNEQLYDIPFGATTENLPSGVLYRVRATYKYVREDGDELNLEVGDIVNVVEYDDPEEQEEGWLMGVKESTGQKGLFPANFTRPI